MSDTPSWLQDEPVQDVAESIAKNPAAQKVAKQLASNPAVQKAVINAAIPQAAASWADETNNRGSGGGGGDYANADDVEAQLDSNGKRINPYAALVAATPKEQIDAMKTFHGMLRTVYIVCSCFMAFVAVRTFQIETSAGLLFFAFYIFIFSLLICCFETQYFAFIAKFLAVNFGFMYNIVGRWVFLLFVGFMCYTLGDLGIAAMAALYFAGVCHAALMYKFPIFSTYQRMLHFDMHKN